MPRDAISWLLASLLAISWLTFWLRKWVRRRRMRRRFVRGRIGESEAADLLRRRGFELLADQLSAQTGLWVDGHWCEVTVRADYLVRRGNRTFVAEVKTGQKATDPTSTATRRQLREYQQVYEVDGLLLVDMEQKQIFEIRFPEAARMPDQASRGWPWFWIVIGLSAAIAINMVAGSAIRALFD